jgi:hypothetical protein
MIISAEKYTKEIGSKIKERYYFAAIMDAIGQSNPAYQFVPGTLTINVQTLKAGAAIDRNADTYDANTTRTWTNEVTPYKLRAYKEYSDVVDAWYGEDTDGLATAVNVLNEFEATSKPVEYTCYYSKEFYAQVGESNLHEAAITSATDAWAKFDECAAAIDNSAIVGSKMAFVSNTFYNKLRAGDRNQRMVMNGEKVVNNFISVIDDFVIFRIPDKYMKSNYTFPAASTGAVTAAADAVQMHMIMLVDSAVITPSKLDDVFISNPENTKGKTIITEAYAYDLFINKRYIDGVQILADAKA